MNLLLLLGLAHVCFPRARRHTWKFLDLSYYNRKSGRYSIGWDDTFLVMHWIVVFTGLRVFVMEYVMSPLAEKAGIHKKKERIRFAEQAWIYVYSSLSWSLGMVSCSRYETSVRH
jgi:very-long-chain ceramide synthase